ncbi:MAG: SDR family NAD(P)-dependent oxidoreductase, partial [Bacillota bacterium]
MFRLDEKVAIVTGGGRGIGEAICLAIGSHGADVVVADVRSDLASRVAAKVEAMGRQALGITVDVSRPEEVRAMVRQAVERFGAVDILVNNAGILQDAFITDISEDDWDRVLEVNLKGAFLCCREVLPVMMRQG